MDRSLFPTREDAEETKHTVAAMASERGAGGIPSALQMAHRFSQYEVSVDEGTGYQTGEFHAFLSRCMGGELDHHHLTPTKKRPEGYREIDDIGILRDNVVIPIRDRRPSRKEDIGGYNNAYCSNPWSLHEIADHFAPYGTVFVINASVAQEHHYTGGNHGLNMYTFSGVGSVQDKWFPLPALLTQSGYVILNGAIVINPFCDGRYRRTIEGVSNHRLEQRCRDFVRGLEDKIAHTVKGDSNLRLKFLRLILAEVPRIKEARAAISRRTPAGTPVPDYQLIVEGYKFCIPHDLPLPPVDMEEFVEEAMTGMTDEWKRIAGEIWANLKPRPMKDVLRIYDELEESSLRVLLERNPDPLECLRKLAYGMNSTHRYVRVQYMTPAALHELRRRIEQMESTGEKEIALRRFERIKSSYEEHVLARYGDILRFFERAFSAWTAQESECRRPVPEIAEVDGDVMRFREEIEEVTAHPSCDIFRESAHPHSVIFERKILKFADPAYYLEILDRIADWGSPAALRLLEDHKLNLFLLDTETIAKVDKVIEKCKGKTLQ